jgi:hypothetical protein
LWPQEETVWSQLRRLSEAPFRGTVDDFVGAWILHPLLADVPVTLANQPVHFSQHPTQQLLRGLATNARTLKVQDLPALPLDLAAHMFDFASK